MLASTDVMQATVAEVQASAAVVQASAALVQVTMQTHDQFAVDHRRVVRTYNF